LQPSAKNVTYHVRFMRICNCSLFPHIFAAYFMIIWSAYFKKKCCIKLTCLAKKPKGFIKNVHRHGMLIACTRVKSISHRRDGKTKVDATKYFDLKGHFKVMLLFKKVKILKSSKYRRVYRMTYMEETNILVIFLCQYIHLAA